MAKTYLVTGAAGFIGSRFVESCNLNGISLISVDHLAHFQDRNEHAGLNFGKRMDRDHLLDLLKAGSSSVDSPLSSSTESVSSSTESISSPTGLIDSSIGPIDAIIHLGAITDTRETDIQLLNRFNLEYSQLLWNYASKRGIPFIYASSAATYGDGAQGYDDSEELIPLLEPLNLYGDSKQRFDLWALQQERGGNHPPHWAGFKFFNVFGFGERHKGFMSSVVLHAFDQIQSQGQVTLFKSHRAGIPDGFQKRDFIFVEDVVDVLHFAIQNPIHRGIFNLGTGQARTFLDLARAVFTALGRQENIQFIDTPLSIRDKYQYFTEAKMEKLRQAGYSKKFTSLEEGVQRYWKVLGKH